jgi:hypothetical protein
MEISVEPVFCIVDDTVQFIENFIDRVRVANFLRRTKGMFFGGHGIEQPVNLEAKGENGVLPLQCTLHAPPAGDRHGNSQQEDGTKRQAYFQAKRHTFSTGIIVWLIFFLLHSAD